jgi:hypothetical protein
MKILQIQDHRLEVLLAPVASALDGCWWWTGGTGASPPAEVFASRDPHAYQRWGEEYATFVEHHDTIGDVGRPGYFGRYAGALRFHWDVYCASDAAEPPLESFRAIQEQRLDWFDAFHEVPPDIALIARMIDGGYWDFFFRDGWMFEMVEQRLRSGSLTSAPWKAFASEREFARHMIEQLKRST